MSVWIVSPVYQDVRSFEILRERLLETLTGADGLARSINFVVVDDTAGQDEQIESLRAHDDVRVLTPPFNLGHQRAIVYGLRRILAEVDDEDAIVTLDADGEDQPADLPRLLARMRVDSRQRQAVVLALRTKRRESLRFKVMYRLFRLLFRTLTGTTVRTGNYAAMPGSVARRALRHPTFDLSYSSAILALDLPVEFVPCERGKRYEGKSKMTFGRLGLHGLRMLMPFTDRIALRALGVFVFSLLVGASLALTVLAIKLFGNSVPGWASFTVLGAVIVSLVALGNFVTLFMLFSQNSAVSLATVEEIGERGDVVRRERRALERELP